MTGNRPDATKGQAAPALKSAPSPGIGIAGSAPGIKAGIEADFARGYTIIVLGNYDPPNAERVAKLARGWLERVAMSR